MPPIGCIIDRGLNRHLPQFVARIELDFETRLLLGRIGNYLDVADERPPGKNQFHRIVNSRDIIELFEVPAAGHVGRQHLARAETHDQLILLATSLESLRDVEAGRREAAEVFADDAVEEDLFAP